MPIKIIFSDDKGEDQELVLSDSGTKLSVEDFQTRNLLEEILTTLRSIDKRLENLEEE